MKVGDYVRTKDGIILKIENIEDIYTADNEYIGMVIYDKDGHFVKDVEIIKSAEGTPRGLLSLIEAGDYVNGGRVIEHAYEPGRLFVENIYVGGKGQTTIENYSYEITSKYCYDEPEFIESIVTKEQFEIMEFKVGE